MMSVKTRRQQAIPIIYLPRPSKGGDNTGITSTWKHGPKVAGQAALTLQLLSDLLWLAYSSMLAWPVHNGSPAATSIRTSHVIDLYLAMPGAVYFYSPHAHQLVPVACEKASYEAPEVEMVSSIQLIYVADLHQTFRVGYDESLADAERLKFDHGLEAGQIAGIVSQVAAEHGLITWFQRWDHDNSHPALGLGRERCVLFVQNFAEKSPKLPTSLAIHELGNQTKAL